MNTDPSDLWRDARVLAPMVRLSTLPLRLLCLERGATLVCSQETHAAKLLAARAVTPACGGVEFRGAGGNVVFRTHPLERGRVVCQLGAAEAGSALRAALLVAPHVAAVDLNMGCPKRSAWAGGGTGVALLRDPERAADIVRTLRRNLGVPVSVKVRLLGGKDAASEGGAGAGAAAVAAAAAAAARETLETMRRLESAGAQAIVVHARRAHEVGEAEGAARWAELRPLASALGVPVLANGGVGAREQEEEEEEEEEEGEEGEEEGGCGVGCRRHHRRRRGILALSAARAARRLRESGCAGVVVGRAALQSGGRIFGALRAGMRLPAGGGEGSGSDEGSDSDGGTVAAAAAAAAAADDDDDDEDDDDVFADCRRYCELCVDTANCVPNSAFVLLWMLREGGQLQSAHARGTAAAKTLRQLAGVWGLGEHFDRGGAARAPPAPPSHHYSADFFYGGSGGGGGGGGGSSGDHDSVYAGSHAAPRASALPRKRPRGAAPPPDFKVPLQRRFQQRKEALPAYAPLADAPPEAKELGWFAPAYRCAVTLAGGRTFASGFCRTKKKAEQQAAAVALQELEPAHPALQRCRHARRRARLLLAAEEGAGEPGALQDPPAGAVARGTKQRCATLTRRERRE